MAVSSQKNKKKSPRNSFRLGHLPYPHQAKLCLSPPLPHLTHGGSRLTGRWLAQASSDPIQSRGQWQTRARERRACLINRASEKETSSTCSRGGNRWRWSKTRAPEITYVRTAQWTTGPGLRRAAARARRWRGLEKTRTFSTLRSLVPTFYFTARTCDPGRLFLSSSAPCQRFKL
jgi:hypothetical protein